MTIGILGYGHFGKFLAVLAARFLPQVSIRIYSRQHEPDGKQFFSLAETASADVVILCGSIAAYEEQIHSALPYLQPTAIVVDVATVKVYSENLFRNLLPQQPYLCMHPMFGPESYRKRAEDVSGFRVVVTASTVPPLVYSEIQTTFTQLGFLVITLSSDEHDRLLAETLFLTHYVSQTILAQPGEFIRTPIDTPSYHALLQAVESVKNDEQLFRDVYRFNPYCKAVADRFHQTETAMWQSLQIDE